VLRSSCGWDADVSLWDALARALEANQRWERFAGELRGERAVAKENAALREEAARRDAELEQVKVRLAVLQRMVFGAVVGAGAARSGGPG
jgi:hypothetical protein